MNVRSFDKECMSYRSGFLEVAYTAWRPQSAFQLGTKPHPSVWRFFSVPESWIGDETPLLLTCLQVFLSGFWAIYFILTDDYFHSFETLLSLYFSVLRQPPTPRVAQAGLLLWVKVILLPQPSWCWEYRYYEPMTPLPAYWQYIDFSLLMV